MKQFACLFFLFALLTPVTLLAQSSAPIQCNAEDISKSVADIQDNLNQAQAAATKGDLQAAIASIEKVNDLSQSALSKCKGWTFEGTGTDALGPLQLEKGTYILEYTYKIPESTFALGVFGAELKNVDQEELIFDTVLDTQSKAGEFKGRKAIKLAGGRYLISITATGLEDWTATLTKP
jgi:hypothetical protein